MEENKLAKSSNENNSLTKLGATGNNMIDTLKPIIKTLVESKYSGVRDEGQGLLLLMKAHELGIGFANAIPHIHIINDRAGIDIHIIKSILSKPRTGITWKKTRNYEAIYNCLQYNKIQVLSNNLPDGAVRVSQLSGNDEEVNSLIKDGKTPYVYIPNSKKEIVPVDYITEYVFTRKKKDIDDTWITEVVTSSFTYSEAIKAGVVTKDVWKKWTKTMIDHRAFTPGAREIASDLLLGNYSYDELLTINGYYPAGYDNDGVITEIKNKDGDVVSPKDISA